MASARTAASRSRNSFSQGRGASPINGPANSMTDSQLARLFQQQERAERELAMIRARIAAARPGYAARHGLLAYPSVDTMRKAVGA